MPLQPKVTAARDGKGLASLGKYVTDEEGGPADGVLRDFALKSYEIDS